ncbi:hypothetical protein G6F31_018703 [Rhizopus arrhizus]|nr:hypothetical protein G6F31_018703 [Rhizopus arrhizus]
MLTLAVAQILWALAYQWDDVTGGSNGLIGVWPSSWLAQGPWFYYLTLALSAAGIAWLRRLAFSPLGYALRGVRDSSMRAEALGMETRRVQWAGFVAASFAAGLAGSLYTRWRGHWWAPPPIRGCRTWRRAAPSTGTLCWAWPFWRW